MSNQNLTIRIDIKKLLNGEARVGGYYLNQSNRSRLPLELWHKGKTMLIQADDLKRVFRKGDVLIKARYGKKDYYVYYIPWRPGQVDPNQEKLFNENRKTSK